LVTRCATPTRTGSPRRHAVLNPALPLPTSSSQAARYHGVAAQAKPTAASAQGRTFNLSKSLTKNTHRLPQVRVAFPDGSIPHVNNQVVGVPGGAVSTERSQMDYCSSCRRHLNGALACPGCGIYAPDISVPAQHLRTTTATPIIAHDGYRPEEVSSPTPFFAASHSEATPVNTGALDGSSVNEWGAESSSEASRDPLSWPGRAARRRQLSRWKKNRRRAAAAGAFAFIGGGLSMSALPGGVASGSGHAVAMPNAATSATTAESVATAASVVRSSTLVTSQASTQPPTAASAAESPRGRASHRDDEPAVVHIGHAATHQ
jgi:hypothetical protein